MDCGEDVEKEASFAEFVLSTILCVSHIKDMVSFGRSEAKNKIFWRVTVTPPGGQTMFVVGLD